MMTASGFGRAACTTWVFAQATGSPATSFSQTSAKFSSASREVRNSAEPTEMSLIAL